jgi:uncharacterized coiled-coil protein SlyX
MTIEERLKLAEEKIAHQEDMIMQLKEAVHLNIEATKTLTSVLRAMQR